MGRQRITFLANRSLVSSVDPSLAIFFEEDVLVCLEQFADQKLQGEHGGFLVGYKTKQADLGKYALYIERFVPIPQRKDASRLIISSVHFATVQQALKKKNGQEEILGWVHTHPGFGTFLSEYDRIQHKRYFEKPWHIALVIDHLNQEKAVYFMNDNEFKVLNGFSVIHDLPVESTRVDEHKNWGIRFLLGTVTLVFLISIISTSYSWLWRKLKVDSTQPKVVLEQSLEPLEEDYLKAEIIYEEEKLESQEANVESNVSNPSLYLEYVVQAGDNLWTIARNLLGDANLFPLLIELNNVENPRMIREGAVLKIPLNIEK